MGKNSRVKVVSYRNVVIRMQVPLVDAITVGEGPQLAENDPKVVWVRFWQWVVFWVVSSFPTLRYGWNGVPGSWLSHFSVSSIAPSEQRQLGHTA